MILNCFISMHFNLYTSISLARKSTRLRKIILCCILQMVLIRIKSAFFLWVITNIKCFSFKTFICLKFLLTRILFIHFLIIILILILNFRNLLLFLMIIKIPLWSNCEFLIPIILSFTIWRYTIILFFWLYSIISF